MALRLRRGTEAERSLITPASGELIYTTDTKKLYVGDGSTVGGNDVTGRISLSELDDVGTALVPPTDGQVLAWDGVAEQWLPETISLTGGTGGGIVEGSNYRINIVGSDSSLIVDTDNNVISGNFTGEMNATGVLDGDLIGSVFSDGSTILVDAVREKIVGDIDTQDIRIERDGNNLVFFRAFTNTTGGANDFAVYSHRDTTDAPTPLTMGDGVFDLVGLGYQGTTYHPATFIRFRTDNEGVPSGDMDDQTVGIPGSILFTVFDDTGVQNLPGTFELNQTGLLVGSINNPNNDQMRVGGNVSASGSIAPGVYADATARDAAITSPYEGMMVFLQDTQKFSGYVSDTGLAGGGASNATPGWVNIN